MRFHFGPPPSIFSPAGFWKPLREPTPWVMQLCALPIGIGLAFAIGYCWHFFVPTSFHAVKPHEALRAMLVLAASFPAIIIVHEFIHAFVHPRFGRSDESVIGFWPSKMLFYGHYTGALSRNRFLAVLFMPFFIISVLPLLFAVTGVLPNDFTGFAVAWCSTWNAIFSCGDIFGFALVLAQTPGKSTMQNDGWKSYWRADTA